MQLKFDKDHPNFEYITTAVRAEEVCKFLQQQAIVSVDTEATGLDAYTNNLLMLQLGTEDTCYIIDPRVVDLKQLTSLRELFENEKIIKLFHNAKFDYKQIKHHAKIDVKNIYDTMLAEGVLNAGLGPGFYNLKGLTEKYTGIKLDKAIRLEFLGMEHAHFTNDQLEYGSLDVLVLFPIMFQQIEKLKKENAMHIAKLEFAVTSVVAEMEYKGVYINREKWHNIIENLKVKRIEKEKEFYAAIQPYYSHTLNDLFGDVAPPINMNSNLQLMELFNDKLKLNMPSTGVEILKVTNHPVVALLREYRAYEKLISSFGETFLAKINPVTNRIHPEFNQMGAATGRFSCNNPNLQQIPARAKEAPFRECFNPEPGNKFAVADYSSMEMRILADVTGDAKFIDAIKRGLDLHLYTASLMFGFEYDESKKDQFKAQRQAAKAINFGLMYGMGAASLARQINVTPQEGEQYMAKYFESYPSVKKFLDQMAMDAIKNGYSITPLGRKRYYKVPSKTDPDYRKLTGRIKRQACNHPIQGTNADAMKYALVFLHERLKKENIKGNVLMTIHDEVVCEVEEQHAEYWTNAVKEEMCRAAALLVKKVPIESSTFTGDVWEH